MVYCMRNNTLSETVPAALRAELARRSLPKGTFAHRLGRSEMWLYRRLKRRVEFTLSDLDAICDELAIEPIELLTATMAAPKKWTTAGGVHRQRSRTPNPPAMEGSGQ